MADAYTSTTTFNSYFTPKSDAKIPDASDEAAFTGVDPAAFAERSRRGLLNDADELARVNGWLGGTKDPTALSDATRRATGGHDNVWPLTNPEPPAVPSEAVLHPGVEPSLVLPADLARAEAAHEEAKTVAPLFSDGQV